MTTNLLIKLLPVPVIEKIAAGEVIERPASVLKELIENSIDANATRIEIVIEDAGFALIRISDNGIGIKQSDLSNAILRHCTSKIKLAEDLFSIGTMGFRGEALASITAVSRFRMTSCDNESGLGYSIISDGEAPPSIEPAQHNKGTSIEVRDLFFNVPARKKFMKSRQAEKIAFLRLLEQIAIPFPGIHFTLFNEGKKQLDLPRVKNVEERIAQVSGVEIAKRLIECRSEYEGMDISFFISDPQNARARPRFQFLYVNLRRVDNDSVTNAVREAFSKFIVSHLRATWFGFIDIDPAKIDVNIHPNKQKIKFDDERTIFSKVFHTIHTGITKSITCEIDNLIPSNGTPDIAGSVNETEVRSYKVLDNTNVLTPISSSIKEEVHQTTLPFVSLLGNNQLETNKMEESIPETIQLSQDQWSLIPCYQIHKMYIMAPIKHGILVIDQHAAHERILYEEALVDLKNGRGESQRLLFPITVSLTREEKDVVLGARDSFNSLGFDIQDFGGLSVAVSSLPTSGFLESSLVEDAVREIVHTIICEKDHHILSKPQLHFAAAFACGAAIKTGKELKQEEMNALLNSLFATKNPYICPHGRPTLIRISMDEFARRFLRQ